MTTDALTAALAQVKGWTPKDETWEFSDFRPENGRMPIAMAKTVATILNAVASDDLVPRAEIERGLSDPTAVHYSMVKGTIAKPSIAQICHVYAGALVPAADVQGLVDAAKKLQADMLERSRAGMDVIYGEEYRIVNAGDGAWHDFCKAIAEWREPQMTAELSTEIDKPCHLRICGLSDETKGCSAKAGQPCQHAPADDLIKRAEALSGPQPQRVAIAQTLLLIREMTAALRRVTAERDEWQAACSTVSASRAIKATGADARAETAEDQLKTVLDREAATTARYDAKMETAEAKVARLRDALIVLSDQWTHGHLWAGESRADVIRGVERVARAALNGGKTDD